MTTQNKNLRIIFIAAIVFLLMLSVSTYHRLSSLIESGQIVNHTAQVTLELEKTIGSLKDAETGFRGYLLTHDEKFLEPFNRGLKEYPLHVENLKELIVHNPSHQDDFKEIESLIEHRKEYFFKMLEVDKLRRPTNNELLIGKSIMDSLRTKINIMAGIENGLKQKQKRHLQDQKYFAPAMILCLSAIAFLILIFSYWQLNKSLLLTQQLQINIISKNVALEKNKLTEANEVRFRNMVEHAPVAISVLRGENFVIEVANEKQLELFGKNKEQVLNLPLFTAVPESAGQGYEELLKGVFTTGEPYIANEIPAYITRGGKKDIFYSNFISKPSYNDEHKIDGIVSVVIDVTEQVNARKKIEDNAKANSQLAAIVQSSEDSIISKTLDGIVTSWNPGAELMFGYTAEEMLGEHINKIIPASKRDEEPNFIKKVTKGRTLHHFETQRLHKNGHLIDISITLSPIKDLDGKIVGASKIARDITDEIKARKKIEESEKQKEFLLKLSDTFRQQNNPDDIEEAVTKIALDFLDVDLCYFCTIEGDNLTIHREAVRGTLTSVAGFYPINNYPLFKAILENGQPFVIDNVQTTTILDADLKQLCVHLQNIAFINVPVIKYGKPVAMLTVVQSEPRNWTDAEVQLTIAVAERTWAALERTKAEKALLKSEEKYRTLFNSIDQGFLLGELIRNNQGKGIDYYVHEVNSTYEKQTGIKTDMVLGKTVLQAFPTIDKWWIETYTSVVDNQSPVRFEKFFEFTSRWFEIKASPAGKEMFTILFTDITERILAAEKIKESEERFRTLAQSLPQLVWITDGDGKFEFGSSRWFDYTGVEPGSDGELEKIIHPDDIDKNNAAWNRCLKSGENYSFDVRLKSKNGNYRWHTVMGEPVKNSENKVIKWVGAFVDTHAEKLFKQELELQVNERTNELEERNSELQKMNKELESFAYISSHDLQEPLRKIQMFSSMIINKDFEMLSESSKDKMKRIVVSANRMQNLIIDLLTYSRATIKEGKFKFLNIKEIIDDVKDDFSEELKMKNAKILSTASCEAEIIPFQFRQLIQNFVSNSLKFAQPNLAPIITIKCKTDLGESFNFENLKPQTKYCCILFSDNGIGFEQQYSEKIFEVFQRLHGKNEYDGTGIGLSIVKKIVENHNGFIKAISELNKGAIFEIYIPVRNEKIK